jgi:hypothetical protein
MGSRKCTYAKAAANISKSKEIEILRTSHKKGTWLHGERDYTRFSSRETKSWKTKNSVDGQHKDMDRFTHGTTDVTSKGPESLEIDSSERNQPSVYRGWLKTRQSGLKVKH